MKRREMQQRLETQTWEAAPEILTVESAAALCGIARNAMYEAIRAGFIPAVNFGRRRLRVKKSVLLALFTPAVEICPLPARPDLVCS
jgi:excisionase family DNA binding protein